MSLMTLICQRPFPSSEMGRRERHSFSLQRFVGKERGLTRKSPHCQHELGWGSRLRGSPSIATRRDDDVSGQRCQRDRVRRRSSKMNLLLWPFILPNSLTQLHLQGQTICYRASSAASALCDGRVDFLPPLRAHPFPLAARPHHPFLFRSGTAETGFRPSSRARIAESRRGERPRRSLKASKRGDATEADGLLDRGGSGRGKQCWKWPRS